MRYWGLRNFLDLELIGELGTSLSPVPSKHLEGFKSPATLILYVGIPSAYNMI